MEIPIKLNLGDQEQVDPLGQKLINVIVSDNGVFLRPGSEDVIDTTAGVGVTGIYDWSEQGYVVAVTEDGSVYKLTDSVIASFSYLLLETGDKLVLEDGSGNILLETEAAITDVTGDTLQADTNRPTFANFGDYLYIANGSQIAELHPSQDVVSHSGTTYTALKNSINIEPGVHADTATYWSATGTGGDAWSADVRYGSGNADFLEDAAPTTVKFITVQDKYLFALEEGTERVHFSVVDEPWSFDSDWFSVEEQPDDVNAIISHNGEVWCAGVRTIQGFLDDGTTPWIPNGYGNISIGVLAPYTFIPVKGTLFFIDNNRRLVYLNGREPVSVNKTLDTYLKTISRLSTALADFIVLGGVEFYILQFPDDGKTVAVNLDNNSWAEWTYEPTGYVKKWQANCMAYVPSWDLVMVGDAQDGWIKKVDGAYSDDDGTAISGIIRTPRMQTVGTVTVGDIAVGLTKVSETTSTGTASFKVRWRDDGGGWKPWQTKTISDDSKTDFVKHVRRCGSYRHNRQYEFDISDLWPYAIQKVEQL